MRMNVAWPATLDAFTLRISNPRHCQLHMTHCIAQLRIQSHRQPLGIRAIPSLIDVLADDEEGLDVDVIRESLEVLLGLVLPGEDEDFNEDSEVVAEARVCVEHVLHADGSIRVLMNLMVQTDVWIRMLVLQLFLAMHRQLPVGVEASILAIRGGIGPLLVSLEVRFDCASAFQAHSKRLHCTGLLSHFRLDETWSSIVF